MNRLLLTTLAAITLCYISCDTQKPQCEPIVYPCSKVTAGLAFTYQFDSADIDPMIIHTYKYDDNFQTLISKQVHTGTGNDSSNANYYFTDIRIDDEYDYKIELPNMGKEFFIHAAPISTANDTVQCPHDNLRHLPTCRRNADYFVVNGDTTGAASDAPYNFYVLLKNP